MDYIQVTESFFVRNNFKYEENNELILFWITGISKVKFIIKSMEAPVLEDMTEVKFTIKNMAVLV